MQNYGFRRSNGFAVTAVQEFLGILTLVGQLFEVAHHLTDAIHNGESIGIFLDNGRQFADLGVVEG